MQSVTAGMKAVGPERTDVVIVEFGGHPLRPCSMVHVKLAAPVEGTKGKSKLATTVTSSARTVATILFTTTLCPLSTKVAWKT